MTAPDNIARLIGGAGVLIATLSLTVAYLTYRRGNPRVEIRVDWEPLPFRNPLSRVEPEDIRNGFKVHLINKSGAAVSVHDVQTDFTFNSDFFGWTRGRVWGRRASMPMGVKVVEGEVGQEISAFGGVVLRLRETLVLDPAPLRKVRVRVTLTNGRKVTGPWMSVAKLEEANKRLKDSLLSLSEVGRHYPDGSKQLAFDEIGFEDLLEG